MRDILIAILLAIIITLFKNEVQIDFLQHFFVSFFLVGLFVFLTNSLALAAGISLAAGVFKEITDPVFTNSDFLADLLGILAAMILINFIRVGLNGNYFSSKKTR